MINKFVEIVNADKCYFFSAELPKGINLNKNLVLLNYGKYSPFTDYDLFYTKAKDRLYIWFYENSVKTTKKIYIPEGYFIFNSKESKENVILYYQKSEYTVYQIFKDGYLSSEIIESETFDESFVKELCRIYNITENSVDRVAEINKIPGLQVILQAVSSEKNLNQMPAKLYDLMIVPASIFFIILSIYSYSLDKYYSKKIFTLKKEIDVFSQKTVSVNNKLQKADEIVNEWTKFTNQYINTSSFTDIMAVVSEAAYKNSAKIDLVENRAFSTIVWVTLNDATSFLNTLMTYDQVKSASFQSVRPSSSEKGKEQARLEVVFAQ